MQLRALPAQSLGLMLRSAELASVCLDHLRSQLIWPVDERVRHLRVRAAQQRLNFLSEPYIVGRSSLMCAKGLLPSSARPSTVSTRGLRLHARLHTFCATRIAS